MAKFFGPIGYAEAIEVNPGVYINRITERNYYGELIRNTSRWSTSSESVNDDLNINNQVSIIADPYAVNNFHSMKYIEFMGSKWKITNVEVSYPRLVLTVGGVYTDG
jgi:hypothetical protein